MSSDRSDQPVATTTDATTSAPSAPAKVLTLRAIIIGLTLATVLAALVPWNDWTLLNTQLYNNYMPPAVTLALLGLGLIVNPLLGRHRLQRGELVVVTVMLLGVGGVVSSGLNRYLPTVVSHSAHILKGNSSLSVLRQELDPAEREAIAADNLRLAQAEFAGRDGNADGRLDASEASAGSGRFASLDSNADGGIDVDEWVAGTVPETPTWRWPVNTALYTEIPVAGQVDTGDAEYRLVHDGFMSTLGTEDQRASVDHRRIVTWRRDPGAVVFQGQEALSGRTAKEAYAAGEGERLLDLDNPHQGGLLRGLRAGQFATVSVGREHQVAAGDSLAAIAAAT
ncbi:MAG: DUF6785 family protein, partial [Planctomycetota bacterium]